MSKSNLQREIQVKELCLQTKRENAVVYCKLPELETTEKSAEFTLTPTVPVDFENRKLIWLSQTPLNNAVRGSEYKQQGFNTDPLIYPNLVRRITSIL